jgi:hypothetical protein
MIVFVSDRRSRSVSTTRIRPTNNQYIYNNFNRNNVPSSPQNDYEHNQQTENSNDSNYNSMHHHHHHHSNGHHHHRNGHNLQPTKSIESILNDSNAGLYIYFFIYLFESLKPTLGFRSSTKILNDNKDLKLL